MRSKKFIVIYGILIIALVIALILSFKLDKVLYSGEEHIETNEKVITTNEDNIEENVEIKYNWQIAIPKINVIAPISEGSDIITLRNKVGHITGTGKLSRKYMFSSDIIIQETILLGIIILTELTS